MARAGLTPQAATQLSLVSNLNMPHLSKLLLLLSLSSCLGGTWMASPGKGSHASGAAAGNEAFSDNFDRADSGTLGANWTVATGSWAVDNNQDAPTTLGFAENVDIYASPCDTAEQYAKFTISVAGAYPGMTFRYTNSASPQYAIFFWVPEGKISWARKASAADSSYATVDSTGGSGTATISAGDIFGLPLSATGTSTVVRIWRSPPTNTPTSATNWGGDTPPDSTFTADPTSPVDTGTGVGINAETGSSGSPKVNDWFAGDTP